MLDVRKLVMLRAVAHEGSIASAARALNYTRSAVSQQLTALEAETGAQLISRVGNRIRLTTVGAALVENTERILVELRSAEAMLDSSAGEVRGLLRVGVPFREGPGIVGRALKGVRDAHPALEIQLVHARSEDVPDQVRREHLDLAVVSRYGTWPAAVTEGLREWRLGADRLGLYVAADHRLAGASRCRVGELRGEPFIVSQTSSLGRVTFGLCAAAGFHPVVAALVDDVSIALRLVGVGWGVTVAPEVTTTITEMPLARLALDGVEVVRESVLLVRKGEETLPRLAVAIEAVRQSAARQERAAARSENAQPEESSSPR